MTLSRMVAEFAPQIIAHELERARAAGEFERVAFFEHIAPEILNGVTDGIRAFEASKEEDSKARWVADAAVDLLRHHAGEVGDAEVDNVVRLAKRIADQAERVCRK